MDLPTKRMGDAEALGVSFAWIEHPWQQDLLPALPHTPAAIKVRTLLPRAASPLPFFASCKIEGKWICVFHPFGIITPPLSR